MIRVAQPVLNGHEETYVLEALRAGQLSQGHFVQRFEREFADYIGRRHALACSNGTTALHLALLTLGLEPGEPVICPAISYVATANAIAMAGGVPVFVDVHPGTWNLDSRKVRTALEALRLVGRPAAGILAVDLYGNPAPYDELTGLALEFGAWVLEDAAEAIGATYAGKAAGALPIAATFSFFGNKTISTGEGGMLVLDDDELAARARLFRGQGMDPDRRYFHTVLGYNYRLGELQAAVGVAQLERVAWHVSRRLYLSEFYRRRLAALEAVGLEFQVESFDGTSGHWMTTVLVPEQLERDLVARLMLERGVETRPAFVCMHQLPMYEEPLGRYPVAEDISRRGLSLPSHAALTSDELELVAGALEATLLEARR